MDEVKIKRRFLPGYVTLRDDDLLSVRTKSLFRTLGQMPWEIENSIGMELPTDPCYVEYRQQNGREGLTLERRDFIGGSTSKHRIPSHTTKYFLVTRGGTKLFEGVKFVDFANNRESYTVKSFYRDGDWEKELGMLPEVA